MCGTDVRCWADGARGGAHHSALSLSESRNGGSLRMKAWSTLVVRNLNLSCLLVFIL